MDLSEFEKTTDKVEVAYYLSAAIAEDYAEQMSKLTRQPKLEITKRIVEKVARIQKEDRT
jgi:uncharacterized protein (DUF2225 family)